MVCKNCIIHPVWIFTNKQQLCKSCFVNYFESKVRGTIRKYQMPIFTIKGASLNVHVINNIIKNLPKRDGKISPENLDNISISVLNEMIHGNSKNLKNFTPINQPLYFLSSKEIELYSNIKGIMGNLKKYNKKEQRINDFIKKIEQKNPDIRHNIIKSINCIS